MSASKLVKSGVQAVAELSALDPENARALRAARVAARPTSCAQSVSRRCYAESCAEQPSTTDGIP